MSLDPRIKAFLNRAAALVAASQGLTPDCLRQLEDLARQLRLEPDEWQYSLDQLRHQTARESELTRYEQAFVGMARERLAPRAGRILSLGAERALLDQASEKFQLGLVRSHQLLEQVCQELDIRRLSRTDAEAGFRELARELLGSSRRAPPDLVSQLVDAGKGWGLNEPEVRDAVVQILRQNAVRRRAVIGRAIRISGLVVLTTAAAGSGLWYWVNQNGDPLPQVTPVELREPVTVRLPDWWPREQMAIAVRELPDPADWTARLESIAAEADPFAQAGLIDRLVRESIANGPPTARAMARALAEMVAAAPTVPGIQRWWQNWITSQQELTTGLPAGSASMQTQMQQAGFSSQFLAATSARTSLPDWLLVSGDNTLASSRIPGQSELLEAWWSQMLYRPDLSSNRMTALLPDLWEASLRDLPEETLLDRRRRVLWRILGMPGPVPPDLQQLVTAAVVAEPTGGLGSWLELWQARPGTPVREWITDAICSRPGAEKTPAGPGEKTARVRQLLLEHLLRRHPALFESQERARASEEAARQAALADPADPLAICVTAQAVNDTLVALDQLGQVVPASQRWQRNQSPASRFPWRFEPPSVVRETDQEDSGENKATRATAADQRTLAQSIGILGKAAAEPDDVAGRKQALEELLRVAPRFEDLPQAEAQQLADYYLRGLELEEWLAAEKSLPGFRYWPAFLLALADRFPASEIGLDQGVTIIQLTGDGDFSVGRDQQSLWRESGQSALYQNALQLLEQACLGRESRNRNAWNLAFQSLGRIYSVRSLLTSGSSAPVTAASTELPESAWALIANHFPGLASGEAQSKLVAANGSGGEFAEVVVAAGMAARILSAEWRARSGLTPEPLENPLAPARPAGVAQPQSGQLLEIETTLLELLSSIREKSFQAWIGS